VGKRRILFTCNNIPSHFDSLQSVIAAFEHAGHTVAVAAPQELYDYITDRGLEHIAAGQEWIKRASRFGGTVTPLWLARAAQPLYLAHMARKPAVQMARTVIEARWEPDLIVREALEFGGALAAESMGIPSACIGTFSATPEVFVPHKMVKLFAPSRRALGLHKDPTGMSAYPFYVSFMPEAFDPKTSFMPNAHFYHDDSLSNTAEETPKWLRKIPKERGLIYACLGSSALAYGGLLKHAIRMMDVMMTAFRKLDDYEIVVSTGNAVEPDRFGTLPDHIRIMKHVPQKEVLARAKLFVTHAGYKSFMEAVAAGTPMITIPLIGDALYTAKRAVEAGVAKNLVGRQVTASAIEAACKEVLTSTDYTIAVDRLRSQMLDLPGLNQLVEDLDDLIAHHSKQPAA
jgi:UDP:flavonoid glycosyltransferase YjiC (YdhE family)